MDYSNTAQQLQNQQAINTVLFIVMIALAVFAIINVVRVSKRNKMLKALEKDVSWRRLKVSYLLFSVIVLFLVIGGTYDNDMQAPLQTYADFQLERAVDRSNTAALSIFVILVLWSCYYLVLPHLLRLIRGGKRYLSDGES